MHLAHLRYFMGVCALLAFFDFAAQPARAELWISDGVLGDTILKYDVSNKAKFTNSFQVGDGQLDTCWIVRNPFEDKMVLSSAGGLVVVDLNGNFIKTIQVSSNPAERPMGGSFGSDGAFYVATNLGHVMRVDITSGTSEVFVNDSLALPEDVAFGPDNKMYVADLELGQVLRFRADTGEFDGIAARGLGVGDIAVNPDGKLFVADPIANKVTLWDPLKGAKIKTLTDNVEGIIPFATLALGPNGEFYAAARGSTEEVFRFGITNGVFEYELIEQFLPQLNPTGVSGLGFTEEFGFIGHAVPEPSTFVLTGIGTLLIFGYRLRRRKRAA